MLVTLILAIGQWVTYFGSGDAFSTGPGAWDLSAEEDEPKAISLRPLRAGWVSGLLADQG